MSLKKAVPLCLPDNHIWDSDHQCVHVNGEAPRRKLTLCDEGLNILKSIDNPVVMICVTGPVRSGKSFFLSQIQNGGRFDVHHGTTSKTTGIWIASSEYTVMRNGRPATLVFLDTEGLGSVNTSDGNADTTWERKVLALSLLLSSYFIFNSQGTPSYDDLLKLGFVGNFGDFIKKANKPRNGQSASRQSHSSSPDFLWLVRDAVLQPEVGNQPCTWSTFLRANVLQNRGGRPNDTRNQIRKAVIDTFGKIDADSLPFPSLDPHVIQQLDSPEGISNLNTQFMEALQAITTKIIGSAKIKREAGRLVCGTDLADLLQAYVKVLNMPDGIIDVESAWDCLLATQNAQVLYTNEMKVVKMPCTRDQVDACHVNAIEKALHHISSKTGRSSSSDVEFYTDKFKTWVMEKLQLSHTRNEELSRVLCTKIKENVHTQYLRNEAITGEFGIKDVDIVKGKALDEYNRSARGPAKMTVLKELESVAINFEASARKMLTERNVNQAITLYKKEMLKLEMPCPSRTLDDLHRYASSTAESFFTKNVPSENNKFVSDRREKMLDAIKNEKLIITENNSCLSLESCENLMQSLRQKHMKPVIDDLGIRSNFQDLKDAFKLVLESFDSKAIGLGPKVKYIREKAIDEMKTLMQQRRPGLIERGMYKTKECYTQQLNNLGLPCSEGDLYEHEQICRTLADKKFWRYFKGMSDEISEEKLCEINWELNGIFDTKRVTNCAESRHDHQQRIHILENKHNLNETLQDPLKRNKENVKEIQLRILREFKQTSIGVGANEFYEKTNERYNETLKQCSQEDNIKVATLVTGGIMMAGLAIFGLAKAFGGSNDDDDDDDD